MLRALIVIAAISVPSLARADSPAAQIKADYDLTCNAEAKSGAAKEADKSKKAMRIATYLQSNLKTPEVKKFLGTLGSMETASRGPALKQAAAAAGYKGACPLADMK
jgi:hypothetical protein